MEALHEFNYQRVPLGTSMLILLFGTHLITFRLRFIQSIRNWE